jgi:hypothetical protein
VTVTGHGKLKRKWTIYLLGSGFVEGITQGVVAVEVVKNTWVGSQSHLRNSDKTFWFGGMVPIFLIKNMPL